MGRPPTWQAPSLPPILTIIKMKITAIISACYETTLQLFTQALDKTISRQDGEQKTNHSSARHQAGLEPQSRLRLFLLERQQSGQSLKMGKARLYHLYCKAMPLMYGDEEGPESCHFHSTDS